MNTQDFVKKYLGKGVDYDGVYGGQCFDLFRQYVKEVLGYPQPYPSPAYPDRGRGAADLWTGYESTEQLKNYYEKIPNTPDFLPKEGDVAIWNRYMGGGHGHVAICTGRGDLNNFESFDQNWSRVSFCELVTHPYKNFYGVLRPRSKEESTSDTQELDKLRKQVSDLQAEVESKNTQIGNYVKQVEGLGEDIERLKSELSVEEEQYTRDMQTIATPLHCSDDLKSILKEIDVLVKKEDSLEDCLSNKRECEDKYSQKATELTRVYERLSILCGIPVASEQGLERGLRAYANSQDKLPDTELDDYKNIIRINERNLWLVKKS